MSETWSVALLNKKKYIYSYLKCIVYDKLLKPRQYTCISSETWANVYYTARQHIEPRCEKL